MSAATSPPALHYILATYYSQAARYAHRRGFRQWIYVDSPDKVLGLPKGTTIWRVGNWRSHKHIAAIESAAKLYGWVFINA